MKKNWKAAWGILILLAYLTLGFAGWSTNAEAGQLRFDAVPGTQ
jgi:hypothetical protein